MFALLSAGALTPISSCSGRPPLLTLGRRRQGSLHFAHIPARLPAVRKVRAYAPSADRKTAQRAAEMKASLTEKNTLYSE